MQFRDASSRVQCYAPFYDPTTKRTRQKLVYIVDKYGKIEVKPTPDDLTPADFGSPEQRQRWADEISTYIDEHNATHAKERVEVLPLMLRSATDGIVADVKSKAPILNAWHRARIKTEIDRLAKALGLVVKAKPKPEKGAKRTSPLGGPATEDIQRQRDSGKSVAEIARSNAISQQRIRDWTTAPTSKEPPDAK
jgi:hypothetical protein